MVAAGTAVPALTAEGVWVSEAPLRSSTGGGDTDGDLCRQLGNQQCTNVWAEETSEVCECPTLRKLGVMVEPELR